MAVDHRTALDAAFRLGVNTNLEFVKQKTKAGPLFTVMVLARRDAVAALAKLVNVPPEKTEDLRLLQNEVQRFVDLTDYVHKILSASDEARDQMIAEDQAHAEAVRELAETEGSDEPGDVG